ncbi:hypothetical protein BV22DRAFT_419570 [Leucogyrophana mollusca]|uniref:Uncharacterized protein n=1 Tax=Leucogyrophana mollusca TaxID=85980 RepID=A0ACB8BJY6_9AGAM|nr:hypothetical protein BV22DRAFT_419570 [Leucogyrophana mollusca]
MFRAHRLNPNSTSNIVIDPFANAIVASTRTVFTWLAHGGIRFRGSPHIRHQRHSLTNQAKMALDRDQTTTTTLLHPRIDYPLLSKHRYLRAFPSGLLASLEHRCDVTVLAIRSLLQRVHHWHPATLLKTSSLSRELMCFPDFKLRPQLVSRRRPPQVSKFSVGTDGGPRYASLPHHSASSHQASKECQIKVHQFSAAVATSTAFSKVTKRRFIDTNNHLRRVVFVLTVEIGALAIHSIGGHNNASPRCSRGHPTNFFLDIYAPSKSEQSVECIIMCGRHPER